MTFAVLLSCGLLFYCAHLARTEEPEVRVVWAAANTQGIAVYPGSQVPEMVGAKGMVSVPFYASLWDPRVHDVTLDILDGEGTSVAKPVMTVTNHVVAQCISLVSVKELGAGVRTYTFTAYDRNQLVSAGGNLTITAVPQWPNRFPWSVADVIGLVTGILALAEKCFRRSVPKCLRRRNPSTP